MARFLQYIQHTGATLKLLISFEVRGGRIKRRGAWKQGHTGKAFTCTFESLTLVISSVASARSSLSKLSLDVIFLTREFPIIVDRELCYRDRVASTSPIIRPTYCGTMQRVSGVTIVSGGKREP